MSAEQRTVESVWEYPRPPRLEPSARHLRITHGGRVIAETSRSFRVLETSHPPVYYLPPADIAMDLLRREPRASSLCEWKGAAVYWSLVVDGLAVPRVAWSYPQPTAAFAAIRDYLAFYASRVDRCEVDGEVVDPQPGDFYGGWITSEIRGPFKGAPGTMGW